MKKLLQPIVAAAQMALLAFGATARAHDPPPCGSVTQTLFAGQNIEVGLVTVFNTLDHIFILYEVTAEGWCLQAVHTFIGSGDFPVTKKGNPKIGKFPYKATFNEPLPKTYTLSVRLDDLNANCDDVLKIVAHAEVALIDENHEIVQEETAFGFTHGEKEFVGSRWGGYFCYTICCDNLTCIPVTDSFDDVEKDVFLSTSRGPVTFGDGEFAGFDNSIWHLWQACPADEKLIWMATTDGGGNIVSTDEPLTGALMFEDACVLLSLRVSAHEIPGEMTITTYDENDVVLETITVNVGTGSCDDVQTGFDLPASWLEISFTKGSQLGIASITYCCPVSL